MLIGTDVLDLSDDRVLKRNRDTTEGQSVVVLVLILLRSGGVQLQSCAYLFLRLQAAVISI